MKVGTLLEHHGIARNPFAEEDAQNDPIFRDYCIRSTYHPTWDKIYGDPAEPATSIVFGEKGAGKTALRLQLARHLAQYNLNHPDKRVYVIQYDDFNPFLDRFRDRLARRHHRADKVLARWQLWDHIDAILAIGTTKLVDAILNPLSGTEADRVDPQRLAALDRARRRDLLLLAAYYDRSTSEPLGQRWHRLRKSLRIWSLPNKWDLAVGFASVLAVLILLLVLLVQRQWAWLGWKWLYMWLLLGAAAGWTPWAVRAWNRFRPARSVVRYNRVCQHQTQPLRRVLMNLSGSDLSGQPCPGRERTDDRYELLGKLQGVLQGLGYQGIVVLVDRVDEPHLINGSAELMRDLVWPMLDNKFLKQPGIGLKLMLPIELSRFIDREDRDFYQRARLDKQNMIPSLQWTGEALYDIAVARVRACAADGAEPHFTDLFDSSVDQRRLLDALRSLRVPRHLFKFMYRLLVAHCNAHTDEKPVWKISSATFDSVLALYQRDQDAFERGAGAG